MATDFRALLEALTREQVEFVILGGVAMVAHGYPRSTLGLDICYQRTPDNFDRLIKALAPLRPTLRGAPRDLPFLSDARTLRAGLNFTLSTDAGDIDLLGEVTGVGGFAELAADAISLDLYGHRVRLISLALLEKSKRAAGRAKDLLDLAAIEEIKKRT